MDKMSEADFVNEMDKYISNVMNMDRSIESKELMITKQFYQKPNSF